MVIIKHLIKKQFTLVLNFEILALYMNMYSFKTL
jgi:hypothetical protein